MNKTDIWSNVLMQLLARGEPVPHAIKAADTAVEAFGKIEATAPQTETESE